MNSRLCILTVLMFVSAQAMAQDALITPEEKARYDAVVQEAKAEADIIFAALPPISDQRTHNMVLKYNVAARGWWAGTRCKLGDRDTIKEYQTALASFTNIMDMIFANDFHKSAREGNTYSQTVQMYALNALSAQKFYSCGDKAKDIWLTGGDTAVWAAEILRNATDASKPVQSPQNDSKRE